MALTIGYNLLVYVFVHWQMMHDVGKVRHLAKNPLTLYVCREGPHEMLL
jgi:hypothetical protein